MRDNYFGNAPGKLESYKDLVDYLNQLNADWVKATQRVSPVVLIELLEMTGSAYLEQLQKLNPFKPAMFAVSWAGQTESPNWFHIAREYTEKWHHQQQIREAVGIQGIMTKEYFYPVMDTFMQAMPHTYRNTDAKHGTCIGVTVDTAIGGTWYLTRVEDTWHLGTKNSIPDAEIQLDPDTAWKLFTKGISAQQAYEKIQFTGNPDLVKPILSMLAVMA